MNTAGIGFTSSETRTTLLTITSYENKAPQGELENPIFNGKRFFSGTMQLLFLIEELLDAIEHQKTDGEVPSTGESGPVQMPSDLLNDETEEAVPLARFFVRILFRQNASWQGTICWLDRKTEAQFRSVLELLILMDGALSEAQAVCSNN